ncbi:MAG: hypothetical protein J3R72DRAFT_528759 [Linnemannia gamsii]|nr:MAG: hypothetical protein J3R72DRAFT_528759 [Linnemannia gamsii]
MANLHSQGMRATLHHHHPSASSITQPLPPPCSPTSTAATTAIGSTPNATSSSCYSSFLPAFSTLRNDPADNKTPIQLNFPSPAAGSLQREESDSSPPAASRNVEHSPSENFTDRADWGSIAQVTVHPGPGQQRQPFALSIPELVHEVCSYLDRQTLVRACRISKQFLTCCGPLLWADIPERAWTNDYFCSHWHLHASRIRILCCAPSVDLSTLSLYCHDLISLDVSRISEEGRSLRVDNQDRQEQQQHEQQQRCPIVQEQERLGYLSPINKQISSRDLEPQKNNINNSINNSNRDTYSSFLVLAESLVQVLQSNKNLECLQFKPFGRIPPTLLMAMAQLDNLRLLSLNGWDDFQEYSLQLVLESCSRLSHLSLGENNFTRFTLESFAKSHSTSIIPGVVTSGKTEGAVVKLERYDDPIKGGNGSSTRYVDQDLLEIHSKQPVLYTPSSPSSSSLSSSPLLERLPYSYRSTPPFQQKSRQDTTLTPLGSCLQSLSLHQSGLCQNFLENLTRQCPRLEHLSLLDGWGFYPSSRFASILAESCPNLRRLEFRRQALDLQDEFFISLCAQFPGLQWIHASKTGFSQRGLDAVRLSCHSIVSLNLDGARGIKSCSLDLLLRTCGTLKSLRAEGVVLNGRDLVKNSRWACRALETLVIDIEIWAAPERRSESVEEIRDRVYDHLSDLTRLQVLGLGGGHRVGGLSPGVDLTIESGIEKLASLQCLEQLYIRSLYRAIRVDDMRWMVENWPRLWMLEIGKCPAFATSRGGDNTNKAVEWLAQSRPGIDIRIY